MIRVLLVDDSAFMRRALAELLESDPEIEVIGVADNGEEAVELTLRLKPDVVTLDIQMPVLDGISALRRIMVRRPTPVVMISSLVGNEAPIAMAALRIGAVDCVCKPSGSISLDIGTIRTELIQKVRGAATARLPNYVTLRPVSGSFHLSSLEPMVRQGGPVELVAIGSSTGGPVALEQILSRLPAATPYGIIVAQHMGIGFLPLLVAQLQSACRIRVREAQSGDQVEPGVVLLCPTGRQSLVQRMGSTLAVSLSSQPDSLYRPSVDVLFHSVAIACGPTAWGIILTGMGDDGADGLRTLRQAGAITIAQDEETSLIYGMPKVAAERNAASMVKPLPEIGALMAQLAEQAGYSPSR